MIVDWKPALAEARSALALGDARRARRALSAANLDPEAPDEALKLLARALRSLGETAAALPLLERVARRQPGSAIAEHNLAAALGDAGRQAESEAAARRAIAKGGPAPETRLILARALLAQGDLDEAEVWFRRALDLRGDFLPAVRDLSQLVWMRSGDLSRTLAVLEPLKALAESREDAAILRASILRDTAGDDAALASLAPWLESGSVEVLLAAAAAASGVDPQRALVHARNALMRAPGDPRAGIAVAAALVATDQAPEAAALLEGLLDRDPGHQHARALLYTAWRMTADPRALTSADYERLVRVFPLDPLPDLDRLTRMAEALRALHPFKAHPFQQSVSAGSQSFIDPRTAGDPDIDQLFRSLEPAIDSYLAEAAPAWEGRPGGTAWRMSGAWSVRLRAGGRHTDHVHPRAWVSSAVYIVTPGPSEPGSREGWLRFGAAPVGNGRNLPAEYWVRPEAGTVVLFPSCLWHGTEPFTGPGERLTVAFDLQPGTTS